MAKHLSLCTDFSNIALHCISDSHLFQQGCGAAHHHAATLFATTAPDIRLIGDTVDFENIKKKLEKKGWSLKKFPTQFQDALEAITGHKGLNPKKAEQQLRVIDSALRLADQGKSVSVYQGNHDIGLDLLDGQTINGLTMTIDDIYDAGEHGKFQIEHGHLFDHGFIQKYKGILYGGGSALLDLSLAIDARLANIPSLSETFIATNLTKKAGKDFGLMKGFRKRAALKAMAKEARGVICGHIHIPDSRDISLKSETDRSIVASIHYLNGGCGQTRGSSLVHTTSGEWQHITKPHKQLPKGAFKILEDQNPLEQYRDTTWDTLQKMWQAHLEQWKRLEQEKTPDALAIK